VARTTVLVTDVLEPDAKDALSGLRIAGRDDAAEFSECEGLLCWPWRGTSELLSKLPSLRMVQTFSAGVDGLDFRALPPGVQVFSNAGAYTDSVAEHAWGLLLGAAKGVYLRNQKTVPRRLRGKTLLVLGCGSIGSEVARLSKSLGMKTVGVSRTFRSPELFDKKYPLSSLAEVIQEADAMVMALPLSNTTRGVVDYRILAKAKKTAIVVNVGRGDSVKEKGLIRWLKERPESRYATDVFWAKKGRESFSTDAWDLPNFAGTLHSSGAPLGETLSGAKLAAAQNVKRFFETGKALNRIDISEYL
jgi:D-3-phosphoglycerate dehydrogenase / 2-oxoglutarate reductase